MPPGGDPIAGSMPGMGGNPEIDALMAEDQEVAKARRQQVGAPVVGHLSPNIAETLYTAASMFAQATGTEHVLPLDGDLSDVGAFLVGAFTAMSQDPALAPVAAKIDPAQLQTDQGAAEVARALTQMAQDPNLIQQLKGDGGAAVSAAGAEPPAAPEMPGGSVPPQIGVPQ